VVSSNTVRFETAPLGEDLDVVGRVEVALHLSVDVPDADVFAELHDVAPDGSDTLVHLSRLRLRFRDSYTDPAPMPVGVPQEVKLLLPAAARRIAAGHRVALTLSGSMCGYAENPNTGTSFADETAGSTAHTTVLTGGTWPSRVRLRFVAAQ
jgi:putative CocE/NonD family hydrolase